MPIISLPLHRWQRHHRMAESHFLMELYKTFKTFHLVASIASK
jgi:hypothetical protein